MIAWLLLLQAAGTAPAVSPAPERFSILADPCARAADDKDIVICGKAMERLPLPANRGPPDRPVPSNPHLSGAGALAASGTPCAATQWGCQTGIDLLGMGTAAVRLVQKAVAPDSCCEEPGEGTNVTLLARDAVRGAKRTFARKPDKSKRIPIPLD